MAGDHAVITARRSKRLDDISEEHKREIKEAFNLFDIDKKGVIEQYELRIALRALGFECDREELRDLINQYDTSESGKITFETFYSVMVKKIRNRDPNEEVEKAFSLFDEDNKGYITLKNLRRVSKEIGENLNDEELQAMIDEFDKELKGYISKDEFKEIMLQTSIF